MLNRYLIKSKANNYSFKLIHLLRGNNKIIAYSYEFEGGVKETEYARKIAELYGWEFYSFTIPKGYLWNNIEEIS